MIKVNCEECGEVFNINREHLGAQLRCTRCGNLFVIREDCAKSFEPQTNVSNEGEDKENGALLGKGVPRVQNRVFDLIAGLVLFGYSLAAFSYSLRVGAPGRLPLRCPTPLEMQAMLCSRWA